MSSPPLQISLVQFDIRWENPMDNISHLEKLLKHQAKADLLLLPEMWSTGFSMRPEKVAETPPGPALQWMIDKSRTMDTVIAGSISIKDGDRYFNRFYFSFPDGRLDEYDKKHLFSYGKENLHYAPGKSRMTIEIKGWRIMPLICYDLRFPVWCRNTDAYDLLLFVANWPVARIAHWDALLKARAIENQCFVAGVNRIGKDGNGLVYTGHSTVYNMNGETLLDMEEREAVGSVVLSKQELTTYREHFRFLQDQDHFTV